MAAVISEANATLNGSEFPLFLKGLITTRDFSHTHTHTPTHTDKTIPVLSVHVYTFIKRGVLSE